MSRTVHAATPRAAASPLPRMLATAVRTSNWAPHLLVGLVALPFVLRQNAWFEWSNALWLLDVQTAHVSAHGLPTYFIHAPKQYFYPENVFYAGPLFSVLAYPSLVLGTWPVFAIVTAATFVVSSAGISWTARNLGVPPLLALVPGVLYALTPAAVSVLYGQGGWTEMVAVSAMSVALGAATSLTTGRAASAAKTTAVLAVAVAVVAGSHNITLLFSALLAPLLALALLPLLEGSRRELAIRHGLVLAGAIVGLAICGVFLVPDLWLSGRTFATLTSAKWLHSLTNFDALSAIFNPTLGKAAGAGTKELRTQTLVVPLVWLAIAFVVLRTRRQLERRSGIALAILGLIGLGITLLITDPEWWLEFPHSLQAVQFPWRLVGFLSLTIALGLSVLLANPAFRSNRLVTISLLLVVAWQIGLAGDFAFSAHAEGQPSKSPVRAGKITAAKLPPGFVPGGAQGEMYRLTNASGPVEAPPEHANVEPIGDDTPTKIVLTGPQAPNTVLTTKVVASPLIRFTGEASPVGETSEGYEVLSVDAGARTPWHATVSAVCSLCLSALTGQAPFALLAGRLATVLGVLALIGLLAHPALSKSRRSLTDSDPKSVTARQVGDT